VTSGARKGVVRARSWSELPETLKPGVYYVAGERFTVYEAVEKEFMQRVIKGVKEMHRKYYG
jgi:hypothetical protein